MKQAQIPPMRTHRTAIALIGTLAWAVAALILGTRTDLLAATGHTWWLWTALTGTGLGVVFTGIGLLRHGMRRV
ncbi:DUF2530 domain-containing protein [Granulicoccus phenolivorans]|uniref:DUF2530 domain-containing protein n=1 Tax=Granulicoccus phenolivorans TaxID=266854 RepID=UPI0003FE914A|nr:DUF2530 domain-containing protein [Granulicoccus phenolivorans]